MERVQEFVLNALARTNASVQLEDGQTLVEYGLIIALISIVAIAALTSVGGDIVNVFNSVAGKLHS